MPEALDGGRMKDCRVHREAMSSYVDGVASPTERAALETHLAQCPECPAALEELQWATRQIRGLEPVEPPPWMAAKIMARLREEEAPSASIWRRYLFPVLTSAQFRVASLVLVGVAGYYIVSRSTVVPPDVREARQAPEARESAPPDQKAFAPPPPARPAPRKEKDAAPAPAPRAVSAPGRDERKGVPPSSADSAAQAAKSEIATAASADFAAPAASEAAGSAAPAVASVPPIAAAPAPRLSQAAPAKAAASGNLRTREATKAERSAPDDAVRLLVIRIDPFDPSGFGPVVESELHRAGADVVNPPVRADGRSLTARLDSRRLPELLERLARSGSVRERPESLEGFPSMVTVTIRW